MWTWKPSWSCDPEHLNKFSSQHPIEDPYEICLKTYDLVFFRKRSLKMLNMSDLGQRSMNDLDWPGDF